MANLKLFQPLHEPSIEESAQILKAKTELKHAIGYIIEIMISELASTNPDNFTIPSTQIRRWESLNKALAFYSNVVDDLYRLGDIDHHDYQRLLNLGKPGEQNITDEYLRSLDHLYQLLNNNHPHEKLESHRQAWIMRTPSGANTPNELKQPSQEEIDTLLQNVTDRLNRRSV